MASKKRFQGRLNLVVIGAAATLGTGCSPQIDDDLMRGRYETKQACVADWGDDPTRCTASSGSGGGHYFGPYYSSTGRVYDQDGQIRSLSKTPSHATSTTTPVKASTLSSHPAVISRGGFGSGGVRAFSGGG